MDARSSFARGAAALLLLLTGCPSSTAGADANSDPALDPVENEALYELNRVREDAGIAATLIPCVSMNKAASGHSDDMRNKGYLKDEAPDGSTVRTRTCGAGYQPGCSASTGMGELVATGIDEGKLVIQQWLTNPDAKGVLLNPAFVAAGIGRALNDDETTWWTLDLGAKDDASCK